MREMLAHISLRMRSDENSCCHLNHLSRTVSKCTLSEVRPAKIQIRLRIRAVWSESSLGVIWIAKDLFYMLLAFCIVL